MSVKKMFFILLLSLVILFLIVYSFDNTSNIKIRHTQNGFFEYIHNSDLAQEWYEEKRLNSVPGYQKPVKSAFIIKTLEDWRKHRYEYLPGASLVPMVDFEYADFFNKYDVLYINNFNINNYAAHAIEIKRLKVDDNKLHVETEILQVAIPHTQGIYFGSYSLVAIDKGAIPPDIEIEVYNIKGNNEDKNLSNVENIYTGFTENWNLFKQKVKIINNESEWQAIKDNYLADIPLEPVDFNQYSLVVLETFNGAKPTLQTAFKIKDIFVNDGILNIVYTNEPVIINNQSFAGIAIAKVKKSLISDYNNIKIKHF